jgi:hypothetical protein
MKNFTDGNVNSYERSMMASGDNATQAHDFKPGNDGTCRMCGKGPRALIHKCNIHKSLDDYDNRHRPEPVEKVDLSEFAKGAVPTLAPRTGIGIPAEQVALTERIKSGRWPAGGGDYPGVVDDGKLGKATTNPKKKTRRNTAVNADDSVKAKGKPRSNQSDDPDTYNDDDSNTARGNARGHKSIPPGKRIMSKGFNMTPGKASGKTQAGKMRNERIAALKMTMVRKFAERVPLDGSPVTIVVKDQTRASHNVEISRGWDTNPDGTRKWRVDLSHNEAHEFQSPEDAFDFVYGGAGKGSDTSVPSFGAAG